MHQPAVHYYYQLTTTRPGWAPPAATGWAPRRGAVPKDTLNCTAKASRKRGQKLHNFAAAAPAGRTGKDGVQARGASFRPHPPEILKRKVPRRPQPTHGLDLYAATKLDEIEHMLGAARAVLTAPPGARAQLANAGVCSCGWLGCAPQRQRRRWLPRPRVWLRVSTFTHRRSPPGSTTRCVTAASRPAPPFPVPPGAVRADGAREEGTRTG